MIHLGRGLTGLLSPDVRTVGAVCSTALSILAYGGNGCMLNYGQCIDAT